MTENAPDRYKFESKLHGFGGFGKIIRGFDNDLQRDIAVKVLADDGGVLQVVDKERFRREARILAKLSHPNIPAIYDVVFGVTNLLIIFQFVEGKNLRQLLSEEGACQLNEVRNWFRQIASAIDYAHANGVIHRDIKPENIIVTPDRQTAYLVDFGIALSAQDSKKLTEQGYAIGTPGYMSPEQLAGKEVDGRADLFSLGVTLYECLAGKPIGAGDYEELAPVNESIPPQIDHLIQECIAPVERRVPAAKAFAARLADSARVTKPLSDILAHGRLHEVGAALEPLDADEFARLPLGQRALVLAKCEDVVTSGVESLKAAAVSFLETLLRIGLLLPASDYRQIVTPAVQWAFEEVSYGRQGNWALQDALALAASNARREAHEVLATDLLGFLKGKNLAEKQNWYLQALRALLNALLANPACAEQAAELSVALREVNRIQRARG